MKITGFLMICVLMLSAFVTAEPSFPEKVKLQKKVEQIVNCVNRRDIDSILAMVSPNARPGLKHEIGDQLAGKSIRFQQEITSYEDLAGRQIKVAGKFAASGRGWNISGFTNFYIFEKQGNAWLLVDTDFHQKMSSDYVFEWIKSVFLIVLPLMLILGVFWLWMLIDCLTRDFEDKLLWVLLLIFLTALGAILYFFIKRRELVRVRYQEPEMDYH